MCGLQWAEQWDGFSSRQRLPDTLFSLPFTPVSTEYVIDSTYNTSMVDTSNLSVKHQFFNCEVGLHFNLFLVYITHNYLSLLVKI